MKTIWIRKGDNKEQVTTVQSLSINIDGGREKLLLLEIHDGTLELTKKQANAFIKEIQEIVEKL